MRSSCVIIFLHVKVHLKAEHFHLFYNGELTDELLQSLSSTQEVKFCCLVNHRSPTVVDDQHVLHI